MGMAASQARLLSLTSRLHDVEYKAQNIEAQKLALATQKDEVYEEYNAALEATMYQVAFRGDDGNATYVTADFNSLCTYQEDRIRDYALCDNKTGRLIVPEDEKENYEKYQNDKFAFAWAMLGYMDTCDDGEKARWKQIGTNSATWSTGKPFQVEREAGVGGSSSVMTSEEWDAFENLKDGEAKTKLQNLYENIVKADKENNIEERDKALKEFREALYTTPEFVNNLYDDKINTSQDSDKTWADVQGEFNYYCRRWEAINNAGGCQAINPKYETGEAGETWLKNMVEAGLVSILENTKSKGVTGEWSETSVATSTNKNYLQEINDTRNQKKAEAKYEHELSVINRKDSKFDTELSKLETERKSITTEMDAIKTVRDDNIDRTFGIFS